MSEAPIPLLGGARRQVGHMHAGGPFARRCATPWCVVAPPAVGRRRLVAVIGTRLFTLGWSATENALSALRRFYTHPPWVYQPNRYRSPGVYYSAGGAAASADLGLCLCWPCRPGTNTKSLAASHRHHHHPL